MGLVVLVFGLSKQLFSIRPGNSAQGNSALQQKSLEQASITKAINQRFIFSIADKHGRILEANENFCAISGYDRDELIGQNHSIVNSSVHDKDFWNTMWLRISSGGTWRGEICNRNKSGDLYWVDSVMAPIIEEDGRIERYISLRADITSRKLSEQALRDSKNLLENVMAASTEFAIICTDTQGIIQIFNSGAEKLLGYSGSELINKATPALFNCSSEVAERASELTLQTGVSIAGFETFAHHPRHHGPETREWTYIRKDGSRVPVSLTVSAIRNDTGDIIGFLGIAKNISQQRLAEETLVQAKEAADQANRAKSAFLANMSHEIRTPLNALIGMAYLLNQSKLTPEQRTQASSIQVASNNLLNVINDILDLSKIEAGELLIEERDFSLQSLFDELRSMFQSMAQSKGLTLSLPMCGKEFPATLRGDPSRINQILINLINNALKFTQKGSVLVDVTVQERSNRALTIRMGVRDTGVGISEEAQARIFTPFIQADPSMTRQFGGTGLGLTITKQLAEKMGGHVGFESQPGVGSYFWLELPLGIATTPSPFNGTVENRETSPLEILVVDDDPIQRVLLSEMSRQLGWKCEWVGSGEEALEKITSRKSLQQHYDCILMDWQMPNMNGKEALERLREQFAIPLSGVVLVTAFDGDELRNECEPELFDDILQKPFDLSTLFNAVNESARRHGKTPEQILNYASFEDNHCYWLPDVSILVVDDSEMNCEVCRQVLEQQGASVTTTYDGNSAISLLEDDPFQFDIVLMDIQMPILDGIETTRQIREQLKLMDLPIVALTAGALVTEREKALNAGMNGFLTKPFKALELVKTLRQFLEEKQNVQLRVAPKHPESEDEWVSLPGVNLETLRRYVDLNFSTFTEVLDQFRDQTDAFLTLWSLEKILANPAVFRERLRRVLLNAHVIGAEDIELVGQTFMHEMLADAPSQAEHHLAKFRQAIQVFAQGLSRHSAREQASHGIKASPTSVLPALNGIDLDAASQIFGQNRSMFVRFIGQFLDEYRHFPEHLEMALARGDRHGMPETLHRIRGNALNLGAGRIAETAKLLEDAIQGETGLEFVLLESFRTELKVLQDSFSGLHPV